MPFPPVSAKVNNKAEGLHYRVYNNKDVEYLDLRSSSGLRAYTRTLFFVLCKAVHDLYPTGSVVIDIPVSNGYYCDLHIGRPVTAQDADALRRRMDEIIAQAMPIRRHEVPTEEAIKLFESMGCHSKVQLLRTAGRLYTTYYELGGYADYFYGAMLTNTSQLTLYALEPYYDSLLLRAPSQTDPTTVGPLIRQDKMFDIFREHHRWQKLLGISTVGVFNEAVKQGHANDIINVAEALQEKKIAHIAEDIALRPEVKMVQPAARTALRRRGSGAPPLQFPDGKEREKRHAPAHGTQRCARGGGHSRAQSRTDGADSGGTEVPCICFRAHHHTP